jgi:ketosteroid isomerase-like protein
MKNLITFIVIAIFAFAKANSQPKFQTQVEDQNDTEQVITDFFIAFHKKDTTLLKSMFINDAQLLSMKIMGNEATTTRTSIQELFNSISSIPDTVNFKEELISITSTNQAFVASVSAPYTFSVNGKLSHSGTNVFTLFKINGIWKIAAIADSRVYE